MAEYDVAHAARYRKGDLNVVVQRHIVDRVAERALKAWMDLVELAKAAGDLRAIGADQQPVHLEQAHLGAVHEQLYRVRLGQVDEAAVLDGVDAKEIIVVGGTDEAFKLREDIRRPASYRSERTEALGQETLVDRRRDTHLMHPPDGLTTLSVPGRTPRRTAPSPRPGRWPPSSRGSQQPFFAWAMYMFMRTWCWPKGRSSGR